MAKTEKEKLEAKLEKAKAAGDAGLVKAISEELVALAKKGEVPAEPVKPEKEAPKADESEALRKEVVAAVRAQGPNPLKRFRVVIVNGGHVVVNPNEQAVSPLNKPLDEGEANKIASRFNALVKPPREALKKAGSTGTIGEQ